MSILWLVWARLPWFAVRLKKCAAISKLHKRTIVTGVVSSTFIRLWLAASIFYKIFNKVTFEMANRFPNYCHEHPYRYGFQCPSAVDQYHYKSCNMVVTIQLTSHWKGAQYVGKLKNDLHPSRWKSCLYFHKSCN